MRGEVTAQQAMFSYVSPEARVPATHPLRAIKARADEVLATLERTFDEMYSSTGRPSIRISKYKVGGPAGASPTLPTSAPVSTVCPCCRGVEARKP